MNTNQFVAKVKKALRFIWVFVLVYIPIVCGQMYLRHALTNSSQQTHQVASYWLPENSVVLTNCPDGEKVYIQTMWDFQKLTNGCTQVLVYPRSNGVRYFVQVGSNLITSQEVGYDDLNSTGMEHESFRRLEDGKVEIVYCRSWFTIGLGVFFSVLGGAIISFVVFMVSCGIWMWFLEDKWIHAKFTTAWLQAFHKAWFSETKHA